MVPGRTKKSDISIPGGRNMWTLTLAVQVEGKELEYNSFYVYVLMWSCAYFEGTRKTFRV
jgi:hypothetical protein